SQTQLRIEMIKLTMITLGTLQSRHYLVRLIFALWAFYSMSTHLARADMFSIAVGDSISNGVPNPGAGNIEATGGIDIYTCTALPGQTIYFQNLGASGIGVTVNLSDTNGTVSQTDIASFQGRYLLQRGGTYTLTCSGYGGAGNLGVGTYGFKLW